MNRISKLALAALVALACAALALPATAHAASPTIISMSKAETKAYNRCVKAAYAYKTKPQVIEVSIKDLKLTKKQVVDVETRLHSNGELWWINTFGLGLSTSKITMPCRYDDATITKMRKKFEKAVATALKRIGPGMNQATKVHMIHDYIIKNVKYADPATNAQGVRINKDAYYALVTKKGDCFGYTLATDLLLRRAGFATDVAFNNHSNVDHSWNLVKVDGKWYHVDTTWDRWYTYNDSFYKHQICHALLLQSDRIFNQDDHKGWEAHYRCTSNKYEDDAFLDGTFSYHCNDYKKIVRSFSSGGIKYQVTGVKRVSVANVNKSARSSKTLTVPATVRYKNVTYTVSGIAAKAFATSKAKTLVVKSTALAKLRVKQSLASCKVKTLKVPKAKLKAYKAAFAKSNSGRKVNVKGLAPAALRAA